MVLWLSFFMFNEQVFTIFDVNFQTICYKNSGSQKFCSLRLKIHLPSFYVWSFWIYHDFATLDKYWQLSKLCGKFKFLSQEQEKFYLLVAEASNFLQPLEILIHQIWIWNLWRKSSHNAFSLWNLCALYLSFALFLPP